MKHTSYIIKNNQQVPTSLRYVNGFIYHDGILTNVKFSVDKAMILSHYQLSQALNIIKTRKDYPEFAIRIIKVY